MGLFLFFYSSMLVLFQYGVREYPSKMISGWAGIATDFRDSLRAAQEKAGKEGQEQGGAKASGGSASGEKEAEVPGVASAMIIGSIVLIFIGFFWLVTLAFQEGILWGIGVLFIPFVSFFYWITHFREATPAMILQFIGGFVIGFVSSYYGIDMREFIFGAPPAPPPGQSRPAETQPTPPGVIVPMPYFRLAE